VSRRRARLPEICFSCRLPGFGWLDCTIATPRQFVTLAGAYTSDVFGDLARAVIALGTGAQSACCTWHQDRRHQRWAFAHACERLQFQIVQVQIPVAPALEVPEVVLLAGECTLRTLVRQIAAQLLELRNLFPPQDYRAQTGYPFPQVEYRALRRLS
jgi:hypothetical protein